MASIMKTLALAALISSATALFPDCVNGPLKNNTVCDYTKDPLTRAQAVIAEFTLAEKINNTGSVSPGVPRLGLPPYQWWQEALHGVASSPGVNFSSNGSYSYATSFPQPILMGAAFDDQLIHDVAEIISTEARAFNNANRTGLDFWTPNINPFRDPRWGRGQETPGEDPYHLRSYVAALIDGLQGGYDPKYKRIVATCKHFAGYDMETWNGNLRYQFDAKISNQELVEYFLPSFEQCARDSNVGAFMCTYSALNGVPTCADPWLLGTILREKWGWTNDQQWVTSDCDSLQNIYLPHQYAHTREQAAADAINAGVDVNCGTYLQHHLPQSYAQGLVNESTITQALVRQYSSLIRLGYFDPPEMQPYRQLTFADVNTPRAQQLALTAAEEGITLLKNANNFLPLKSLPKSIALIGDWANATTQMQGNYYGVAPYLISPLQAAEALGITINFATGPGGPGDPTTNNWNPVWTAANQSEVIIYAGGIDNSLELEDRDRNYITWTGAQLDVIGELAEMGKPMMVFQMGGGQIDSSPIVNNKNISALLWGGYPGQSGGQALINIITGKTAPAGRLPITQYPAHYTAEVPMTDMNLRPGVNNPGRTYKWYNGTAVFPFGYGLHYTTFSAQFTASNWTAGKTGLPGSNTTLAISDLLAGCTEMYKDKCALPALPFTITNTGNTTSDYAALLFIKTSNAGPAPYPNKELISYARMHNITAGCSQSASYNLTVGSLVRVDTNGNKMLYPGSYELSIDTPTALVTLPFTLTGSATLVDNWPARPIVNQTQDLLPEYFVGGYGSGALEMMGM